MPLCTTVRSAFRGLAAAALLMASAGAASAQTDRLFLQWFENEWEDMERRVPDFFLAGYNGVWLPPISRARDPDSPGYDVFDRFDLGRPGAPTVYGTESGWHAARDELQNAGAEVTVDIILNHNSGRDGSVSFQLQGGYPGFWMNPDSPPTTKGPGDDWGDFHSGNGTAFLQSENPSGPNYDLFVGDLVALVDIAQESNNQFIRHPVDPGDPLNIPAGTIYNQPDLANYAFYPDMDATPEVFTNPGVHGHGTTTVTRYPFPADPMDADPVTDNTTGLLMRYTQWMIEVQRVDGFRLDAAKHIPNWFWDVFWDTTVHMNRLMPDGRKINAFSYVEAVAGNSFVANNYVRKDSFADRDALDLNGAGALRNINNAGGFGSWLNVLDAHIDNEDFGLNNGSLGVNHVFSHDNGSTGGGSSMPQIPLKRWQAFTQNAYVLLRPGPAVIYHHSRGIPRSGGFFPREGIPLALGIDPDPDNNGVEELGSSVADDRITSLVRIANMYARGDFAVINGTASGGAANQSFDDVMIMERWTPSANNSSNLLFAVSDRYDAGFDARNVETHFRPGTRLHELTGFAGDPVVDPGNNIPSVLTVDANRRVTIAVPRNASSMGEHHSGYVAYGPAVPDATMTITPTDGQINGDPATVPIRARRLADVPIVTADTFDIVIQTTQADALDPNTDDFAAFKINKGFQDLNGNGGVDHDFTSATIPGFENFLTENSPLFTGGTGRYVQTIDATQLGEGYHYITAYVFRHRDPEEGPLYRELRQVIYVDRACPDVAFLDLDEPVTTSSRSFRVRAQDRTTQRVHLLLNVPAEVDPIPLAGIDNLMTQFDRFDYSRNFTGLQHGPLTLTAVVVDESGRECVITQDVLVLNCAADTTTTGAAGGSPDQGNPDGDINLSDLQYYLTIWQNEEAAADVNTTGATNGVPDGDVNLSDLQYFLTLWQFRCL